MMRALLLGAIVLTPANATSLLAQSDWCAYRPGTMRALTAQHHDLLDPHLPRGHRNFIHDHESPALAARVTYLGRTRMLPWLDSLYLDVHLLQSVHDTAFRTLFTRQAAFAEGRDTMWLPIQDSLITSLNAEAARGDTVTLFIRWLGLFQEGRRATWVFTINEFGTLRSRAEWQRTLSSCTGHVVPRVGAVGPVLSNKGLKLTSRLAVLAGLRLRLYAEASSASAAKAPARSLSPGR